MWSFTVIFTKVLSINLLNKIGKYGEVDVVSEIRKKLL